MTYTLALFLALAFFALVALQLFRLVKGYIAASGTPWQRFLAGFSDSLTIAVSRLGSFLSLAGAFVVNVLPSLDPSSSIGTAITGFLDPKYVPFYVLGFAVLIELVRRRPGSVDPILPPAQAQ